jgi:serine phosphatase RsbU (regulator of sigma subunit)
MNNNMEEYGEERLIKLITKNSRINSSDLLKTIFADIIKFRGTAEQSDDITCGIIKVR